MDVKIPTLTPQNTNVVLDRAISATLGWGTLEQ